MKKAVALGYNRSTDSAPKVLAKGSRALAEQIVKVAQREKLPVLKEPLLAEGLSNLELGQVIPEDMYVIMAEIFSFLYQQKVDE